MIASLPPESPAVELLQAPDIVIDNSLAHGQTGDSSIVGDRSLLDGEDHGPPVIGEQRSKTCRRVEATTKGIALQQPHVDGSSVTISISISGRLEHVILAPDSGRLPRHRSTR
jgi:hypothetical protein